MAAVRISEIAVTLVSLLEHQRRILKRCVITRVPKSKKLLYRQFVVECKQHGDCVKATDVSPFGRGEMCTEYVINIPTNPVLMSDILFC
jgi:hypothetical protein